MSTRNIVIGIDTGGTYTDTVAYDLASSTVLAKGKSRTTKEDLSVGIASALDTLPMELLSQARRISLSTTLATNACVEGKGCRAKLVMMGTTAEVLARIDAERKYGLKANDVLCLDTHGSFDGSVVDHPDWEAVIAENLAWLSDAQALGVVEANASRNGAVCEKRAKEVLGERFGVPVVMASQLASDLNMMERGATALLNARLLPVIEEFLHSVREALAKRRISAPVYVVRSDGSLMDAAFAEHSPVETILSGPAASILGAGGLARRETCLIVDMGGTTTDVSLVEQSTPVLTDRIRIGNWKTQVKGAFVETFGLGGDSAVRVKRGKAHLAERRVEPISAAAQRWPQLKDALKERLDDPDSPHANECEGLYLVRAPHDLSPYTQAECQIIDELAAGPALIGSGIKLDRFVRKVDRLESEGILMRFGFTPTDAMHILGDFNRYDADAARMAARIIAREWELPDEPDGVSVAQRVYQLMVKKVYESLVRILIKYRYPETADLVSDGALDAMIERDWRRAELDERNPLFDMGFATSADLVGVGAPTRLFMPAVAKLLGAPCVTPEHSEVANAVGAALATIRAKAHATVVPAYDEVDVVGYVVHCPHERKSAKTEEEALEIAEHAAREQASALARERGAKGDLAFATTRVESVSHALDGQEIRLETRVSVTAAAQ